MCSRRARSNKVCAKLCPRLVWGSSGIGTIQVEEPDVQWKAAAFVRWHEPDDARVSSPVL
jgi:hypothetical protein